MNLSISTNYSTPSFGIKTYKGIIQNAATIITGGGAAGAACTMTVEELTNRAKVMADNEKNIANKETSVNSLIDVATIKDQYRDKELKETFSRIMTEIESRPDIQNFIKRNDSEFIPEGGKITYSKYITLSDGRRVNYEYSKHENSSFSTVILYPGSDGLAGHDYVGEFSIMCDRDGKSCDSWAYEIYQRHWGVSMEFNDNEPDYISPVSK